MPTDLPMAILFLVFLVLFMLLGTSPVLHRLLEWLVSLLLGRRNVLRRAKVPGMEQGRRRKSWRENELNDYEIILLRKLASSGDKGLSRRALIESLYFKPSSVDRALDSLYARGLIRMSKSPPFGGRVLLSATGKEYAVSQDLMPRYQLSAPGKKGLRLVR